MGTQEQNIEGEGMAFLSPDEYMEQKMQERELAEEIKPMIMQQYGAAIKKVNSHKDAYQLGVRIIKEQMDKGLKINYSRSLSGMVADAINEGVHNAGNTLDKPLDYIDFFVVAGIAGDLD